MKQLLLFPERRCAFPGGCWRCADRENRESQVDYLPRAASVQTNTRGNPHDREADPEPDPQNLWDAK